MITADVVDEADLQRGREAAARAIALVSTASGTELDLGLLHAAEQALTDLAVLHASVLELRERLWAGALDADARDDLAIDVLASASRVQGFALAVRA